MIEARIVAGHSVATNLWAAAAQLLALDGIRLLAGGQDAWISRGDFGQDLSGADVVLADLTGAMPGADALEAACRGARRAWIRRADRPEAADPLLSRFDAHVRAGTALEAAHAVRLLLFAAGLGSEPPAPTAPLLCGFSFPGDASLASDFSGYASGLSRLLGVPSQAPVVALLWARTSFLDGDEAWLAPALSALAKRGILGVSIVCDHEVASDLLREGNPLRALLDSFGPRLGAIWNGLISHGAGAFETSPFGRWNVPVQQLVRTYTQSAAAYRESPDGLSAMSATWSVALPELLGAIEPVVYAGTVREPNPAGPGTRMRCDPLPEEIERIASRSAAWIKLRSTPTADRKVAILLHHATCASVEGTLGTAGGLDGAQSCVELLHTLRDEGWSVEGIPDDGKALVAMLLEKRAIQEFRWTAVESIVDKGGALALVGEEEYRARYDALPQAAREAVEKGWGPFPGKSMALDKDGPDPRLVVSGLRFGNVLVMTDPKRGCWGSRCDGEVCRILHDPDIPPPHQWLATFWWLQRQVDALVPLGAEGPIEWLPGRRICPSALDWSSVSVGHLPVVYPYHSEPAGEALVAKRRALAVTVGHLPVASAEIGEDDANLAALLDLHRQWKQAGSPSEASRRERIEADLREKVLAAGLWSEPGESDKRSGADWETFRDDLPRRIQVLSRRRCKGRLHVLGRLPDAEAKERYRLMLAEGTGEDPDLEALAADLGKARQELSSVVGALAGGFVAPGPGGSLLRGRRDVLPTGRNLFGIDLRRVPTEAAQKVGEELGAGLLRAHLSGEGRFPRRISIALWSSDVFQSEGEVFAQILWLLGCRPLRDRSGAVTGIEIVPAGELFLEDATGSVIARPRVDVMVQMSGVVRDSLPAVWSRIDEAVRRVAALDEPHGVNHVRAARDESLERLRGSLDADDKTLERLATARVFSSRPGSFGTGVDLQLAASAWNDDKDLAETWVNWTGWAYGQGLEGRGEAGGVQAGLQEYLKLSEGVEATFQKAVGPEWDALSITSYAAFQGGASLAPRLAGKPAPRTWWGSTSRRETAVRDLREEIDEALCARLSSAGWLAERKDEGYQGATALLHLSESLFAWEATAKVVEKRHFDQFTHRVLGDPEMRAWLREVNPHVLESVSRRLLEASRRGLWIADEEDAQTVQDALLEAEGEIEAELGEVRGEMQGSRIDIRTRSEVAEWTNDFRL
jgi:cobaltochelatase CobN